LCKPVPFQRNIWMRCSIELVHGSKDQIRAVLGIVLPDLDRGQAGLRACVNLTLSFLDGPDVCRTGMSCRALSSRVLSSEAVWAAMILPHRFGPAVLALPRQNDVVPYLLAAAVLRPQAVSALLRAM
jgi:hypothetical protein